MATIRRMIPNFASLRRWLPCLALWMMLSTLRAVEIAPAGVSPYTNSSNTISGTVSSWTNSNSWGSGNTNTGWDYVGSMNGASGVYLGNGWVLTAGHVGAGDFTLNGNTYKYDGYSYTNFTASISGTNFASDLNLFRISTTSTTGVTLNLPSLTIASSSPTIFTNNTRSNQVSQSQVVMIGFSGGSKSWGVNNVTGTNQGVLVNSFGSADFSTSYGALSSRFASITNNAKLVTGDSGGGGFMYSASQWVLSGINEANDNNGSSYMVQLSFYASAISNAITAAPSPSPTPTPSPSPTATPTPTPSPTPSATPSPTGTPTPSPTTSPTPSATPTPTPSPTPSAPVNDEPTMPEWGLILLSLLLAGYVLRAIKQGTGNS